MIHDTQQLSGNSGLQQAIKLLCAGECVALPTETVYGLAADASNELAVKGIFEAKGRPSDHPLIVHVGTADNIEDWAINVPGQAYKLAEAFWPGPLTILLEKAPHVSEVVTGGHQTIALRVPSHPLFRQILLDSGLGLAAPSANRYKKLSPTSAEQVFHSLSGRIAAVLDGGLCEFGLESTIVDLTTDVPTVVRSGPVGRSKLEEVLGSQVVAPEIHNVAVSGNVEAHYQPNARMRFVPMDKMLDSAGEPKVAYLVQSDATLQGLRKAGVESERIQYLSSDPVEYGRRLFHTLYQLDQAGFIEILLDQTPADESWAAVNDRLKRAVGL